MVNLTALGLTQYENKAYEAILKIGKGTAMEISRESEVPYGRIYDTLSSLQDKGLVNLIPERTKKFQAAPLENLKNIIKTKQDEIDLISDQIETLKINLGEQNKTPIFLTGIKNFRKLIAELEKPKNYEYNLKFSGDIFPEWVQQKKNNIRSGVDVKDLIRNVPETKENVKKWLKVNKNIREYNNNGGVVLTIIDDNLAIISSIKTTMIIVLREETIVRLFKDMFLALYNNSPPLSSKALIEKSNLLEDIKRCIFRYSHKKEYEFIGLFGSFINKNIQQINDIDLISIGHATHHQLLLKELNQVLNKYGYKLKPFKTIKNVPNSNDEELLLHDLHYSDVGEMYKMEWPTVINTIKRDVVAIEGNKNFFNRIPFLKIKEEDIILPLEKWLYEIEDKNKFETYLTYLKKIIPKLLTDYPELNLGHLFRILSIQEKDWKIAANKIKELYKLKPVISDY